MYYAPQPESTPQPQPAHESIVTPLVEVEKSGSAATREVVLHRNFDYDLLHKIAGMQPLRNTLMYASDTGVQIWVLFNAITTTMVTLTNFFLLIPQHDIEAFGSAHFNRLRGAVLYFPLVYFLLIFLLFNNVFSERVYYKYLCRGAIIDYPDSAAPRYLLTHFQPLLFIVSMIAYLGLTFYAFGKFRASVGTIAVVLNNVAIGIGLFWYRQQSIEIRFSSLSYFIQAFPDADGKYDNIDANSLHLATDVMKSFVLTECETASYSSYMRLWMWSHIRITGCKRFVVSILMLLIVFGLGGLAFTYFFFQQRSNEDARWRGIIIPATGSCIAGINATVPFYAPSRDTCELCICAVIRQLLLQHTGVLNDCDDFFKVPMVNGTAACPSPAVTNCPASC